MHHKLFNMQRTIEQVLNLILHASERMEEDMKQESGIRDLTVRQMQCIESIAEMKNPTLSELAEVMGIAKASISVMIDRLEKNSYLFKATSDSDRRAAHVHLTAKGEKAAVLHTALHQRISLLLTKDMTDSEKEILKVLLNKSVKAINNNWNFKRKSILKGSK